MYENNKKGFIQHQEKKEHFLKNKNFKTQFWLFKFFNRKNVGAGFTLIELLIVITIIGLLVAASVVALNNARKKARDVKRIATLKQLKNALEVYYSIYGSYPTTSSYGESLAKGTCTGGFDCSHEDQEASPDGMPFMEFLQTSGLMSEVPVDPVNNSTSYFSYYSYTGTGTAYGCTRPFYVLRGFGFETGIATGDEVCWTGQVGNNSVYVIIGGPNM